MGVWKEGLNGDIMHDTWQQPTLKSGMVCGGARGGDWRKGAGKLSKSAEDNVEGNWPDTW